MTQFAQPALKTAFPLPATRQELLDRKTMRQQKTLNDHVDDIHVALWGESEDYVQLLDAVYDEQAVEGSLSIDNAKAAEIIRNYAREHKIAYVANQKLSPISKALNVVLRRYHMSRQERRVTVGGETMLSSSAAD